MNKNKAQERELNLLIQRGEKALPQFKRRVRIHSVGKTLANRSGTSDPLFDNLITVEELAVIFRVSPQTIRNRTARGKIPHIQIGRRNLFRKRSLQQWLIQKEEPQWQ